MPAGYLQIPDWFSAENAGGGVAIADLDGNGKQDLVVFIRQSSDDHNSAGELDLWGDRADRVSRCGEYSLGLSDPKLRHDPFLRYQPAPRRSPDQLASRRHCEDHRAGQP